jgi:hypothetical protein
MGPLFGGTVMAANRVLEAINITPNSSLPGTAALEGFVGGLITFVEIICFAALICAAGAWATAHCRRAIPFPPVLRHKNRKR